MAFIGIWIHSFCHVGHMASFPAVFLFLINFAVQQSESYILEASSS